MNVIARPQDIIEAQVMPGFVRKIAHALLSVFSGAKGYQGGWEGGARGL